MLKIDSTLESLFEKSFPVMHAHFAGDFTESIAVARYGALIEQNFPKL